MDALREALQTELDAYINIPDWYLQMMQAEYEVGANGFFTPEMQYGMIQSHLETLRLFVSIVLFDVSSKLSPFDEFGDIRYSATQEEIQQDVAHAMTNNPNSNQVVLGTDYDGVSWHAVGKQRGMSYFYSPQYNQIRAALEYEHGPGYMAAVNRQYIKMAKAAGKQFWFSHDPLIYLAKPELAPGFYAELEWLREEYGIAQFTRYNFVESGPYWCFRP